MGLRPTDIDAWLAIEERQDDEAAEAAFARAVESLPPAPVSRQVIDRIVLAVQGAARHDRRLLGWAQTLAAVFVLVVGAATALGAVEYAGASMLKVAVALVDHSALWLVGVTRAGVSWWSTAAHIGTDVGAAVSIRQGTIAILGTELLGFGALLALRRLLQPERGHRNGEMTT